jgi:hypothetical protein
MISLSDVKAALEAAANVVGSPLHVAAFTAWILRDDQALRRLVTEASNFEGQSFLPEHAAVLGYGLNANVLPPGLEPRLKAEIIHISGRTFFAPNRARRFEVDGVALLGVTLATTLVASEDQRWVRIRRGPPCRFDLNVADCPYGRI